MNPKSDPFQISFYVVFSILTLLRLYYKIKANVLREIMWNKKEGPFGIAFRLIFGIPMAFSVFTMVFIPGSVFCTLPLPDFLRFAGVILGFISLLLLIWVHQTLGNNFSTSIECKKSQCLIRSGPYRYIRHPMYLSYLLLFVSGFFMSENLLFGVSGLCIVLILMTIRLKKEENLLLERFGRSYQDYMRTTPRFFPRTSRGI